MLIQTFFVTILFVFCGSNAIDNENGKAERSANDTLIFAHVMIRHGDRNVRKAGIYPTDPWHHPSHWPGGIDQLTTLGIQATYEFGKYLRKRYHTLIGNKSFSDDLVYFHSTDVPRCLMSASLVAASLFPPSTEQTWNSELNWFPIPIHTIPKKLDHVLYAERPCKRYDRAFKRYYESPKYKAEIAKHKDLIQYLEKHSGVIIKEDLGPLHFLYDTLWIEQLKNKTLPDWTQSVFGPGTEFEQASNRYFQVYTMTPELSRLTYGFFVREVFDRFNEVIKGTLSPNRLLWLYFAHDTTIASILNLFGLYNNLQPPYSSSLHFELYKTNDNKFYMQLSYKNSSEAPILLSFPNCATKCSIEELKEIYKEYIPTQSFEEECRLPLLISDEDDSIFGLDSWNLAIIILVIVFFIVFTFAWCAWKRKYVNIQKGNMKI